MKEDKEKMMTMGSGFMTDRNLTYEEKGVLFLLLAATDERTYTLLDMQMLLSSNGKVVNFNDEFLNGLLDKRYITQELYKGDKPILFVYKVHGNKVNTKKQKRKD